MHHGALEGQIFACPAKALTRGVTHIWVHTSDGTKILCAYWDSVDRGDVTERDMSFHMKFAEAKLGYPSRNIPLDRIETHSNRAGGACAMKLEGFDYESIENFHRRMIYWNTFNSSYQVYIKVWKPKISVLQDLQTWKGRKIIQGKNFIQCTGGGTIKIAPST